MNDKKEEILKQMDKIVKEYEARGIGMYVNEDLEFHALHEKLLEFEKRPTFLNSREIKLLGGGRV